jgi:hypothetical protein
MDPNEVVNYAKYTIKYLEEDKISFKKVMVERKEGWLGFAMISTAMAAFDVFAWILYQSLPPKKRKSNKDLFEELINDNRFFSKARYHSVDVFYSLVRCGVMHQLYPKNIDIYAELRRDPVLSRHERRVRINPYALYCDVLKGCEKIRDYLAGLPDGKKLAYSRKLSLRRQDDEKEYAGSKLDISILPEWSPLQVNEVSFSSSTPYVPNE